jgi:hypothetical protein
MVIWVELCKRLEDSCKLVLLVVAWAGLPMTHIVGLAQIRSVCGANITYSTWHANT